MGHTSLVELVYEGEYTTAQPFNSLDKHIRPQETATSPSRFPVSHSTQLIAILSTSGVTTQQSNILWPEP